MSPATLKDLFVALLLVEVLGERETGPGDGGEGFSPPNEIPSRRRHVTHASDPNAATRAQDSATARRAIMADMSVKQDCRHYVLRTVRSGERTERCRLGAAETVPFGCPDGCVFYEAHQISHRRLAGSCSGQRRPTDDGALNGPTRIWRRRRL